MLIAAANLLQASERTLTYLTHADDFERRQALRADYAWQAKYHMSLFGYLAEGLHSSEQLNASPAIGSPYSCLQISVAPVGLVVLQWQQRDPPPARAGDGDFKGQYKKILAEAAERPDSRVLLDLVSSG